MVDQDINGELPSGEETLEKAPEEAPPNPPEQRPVLPRPVEFFAQLKKVTPKIKFISSNLEFVEQDLEVTLILTNVTERQARRLCRQNMVSNAVKVTITNLQYTMNLADDTEDTGPAQPETPASPGEVFGDLNGQMAHCELHEADHPADQRCPLCAQEAED